MPVTSRGCRGSTRIGRASKSPSAGGQQPGQHAVADAGRHAAPDARPAARSAARAAPDRPAADRRSASMPVTSSTVVVGGPDAAPSGCAPSACGAAPAMPSASSSRRIALIAARSPRPRVRAFRISLRPASAPRPPESGGHRRASAALRLARAGHAQPGACGPRPWGPPSWPAGLAVPGLRARRRLSRLGRRRLLARGAAPAAAGLRPAWPRGRPGAAPPARG